MNYNALTLEELGCLAITDAGARAFIAENAVGILIEAVDFAESYGYDPAVCWDDGYQEGRGATLRKLSETYGEQLLEWIGRAPHLALYGGLILDELETMLAALHAEFEDEAER